jgi:predicted nucleic acid-binding protein
MTLIDTDVLLDLFTNDPQWPAVAGWPLLTRDARRYRTEYPSLELVAPNLAGLG